MVDGTDEFVRVRRDDRARVNDVIGFRCRVIAIAFPNRRMRRPGPSRTGSRRPRRPPAFPQAGEGEHAPVRRDEADRLFTPVSYLPFIKSVDGDEATATTQRS